MQDKAIAINKIEFKQTNNIFVNAGIVALHRYINKFTREYLDKYIVSKNVLEKNKLIVECDDLMNLLEDVYYFMGKEIYDTVTAKQWKEAKNNKANFYYKEDEDKFYSFPKINTYGLTQLFTNNAQGNTRHEENTSKIKTLEKNNPNLANKFKSFFESQNVKLLSKIYFNEPYTKITRITISPEFFEEGNQKCPILNESFKKLVEGINISPFISGITNFNTFFQSSEKKISLKALYLIRFSPALVFYHYNNGYDTLICSFFNSNTLENISFLHNPLLYKSKEELMYQKPLPYTSNFNFYDFKYQNKDKESYTLKSKDDAVYTTELSFLMLYTFYKRNFESKISEKVLNKKNEYFDPFSNHPLEKIPISIVSFRADKFASTLRPNEYEEFNNVKYIFRLIYHLEHNNIPIKDIWYGLKLKTEKTKMLKFDKAKYEERKIRGKVFENILKGKSILTLVEKLFYESFNSRINGFNTGFRKYDKILEFLLIYEQTLKTNIMDKELQKKAISLGKSIGQGIIRFDEGDALTNAKSGRKYLIGLHKARTLQQFLDALYRIANKYGISVSNDILENIDEDNFMLIRQFALLGALNQLNMQLSTSQSKDSNN